MGYSPWGCKESDTTDGLTLLLSVILLITNLVFFSEFSTSLLFRGQPHETLLDLDH